LLENTFLHIPDIGEEAERSLWRQGCLTWADFLADIDKFSCGYAKREAVREYLELCQGWIADREHRHFASTLGHREAWRAFPDFRDRCVFLDIETDGGRSGSSVTTIGMYDGKEFRCLVKGRDLRQFPEVIRQYGMIVTFFGASFDLPMLQKCFRGLKFDQIHLDLCPTLRRLGHHGGLKKIEKRLGIGRGEETDGLDGLDAIRLWRRYQVLGEESALETLIAYNRDDVVNLETLALYAYEHLKAQTFKTS